MNTNKHTKKNRYILIDDDPFYRAIILRVAKNDGIEVDVFESLMDLGSIGLLGQYDSAIVDYDLGSWNGLEIAEYLAALFGDIPMILVSEKKREPEKASAWPKSIKKFIKKGEGYSYVLAEAKRFGEA